MAKKKTKWTQGYRDYREAYYKEKRRHNIKQATSVLSLSQYKEAKKEGMTNYQMLKAQKIIQTKTQERETWRQYKRMRRLYERGETLEVGGGYEGLSLSSKGGISKSESEKADILGYHYNLSGLLADGNALHALITFEIDIGNDKKEVLAQYGY